MLESVSARMTLLVFVAFLLVFALLASKNRAIRNAPSLAELEAT